MRVNENMGDLDTVSEGSVGTEHQPLQNEATYCQKGRHEGQNDTEEWEKAEQEVSVAECDGACLQSQPYREGKARRSRPSWGSETLCQKTKQTNKKSHPYNT